MSKKYNDYKSLDLPGLSKEVLDFWEQHDIFHKSISTREGAKSYVFYEGPPSANGSPGIHHVMARTIKDVFCRYKTLKGYVVKRKGGWDTHGLPVELQVEKELGITKEDIGTKISVEEYNDRCKEAVMKYKDRWDDLTVKMGYWLDLDDPYITFDSDYIETVWYLLKRLFDQGYLYKGYTIQPYSPAAGTGLSSHELNQPGTYKDVKDTSIVAQFKIRGTENDYFLAWTTTPWTLPANSALAVGENINYVKIATLNPYTHERINVILAEDRVGGYFDPKGEGLPMESDSKVTPWEVTDRLKGKDLVGMDYEQLLPYIPLEKPAFTVVAGDFVTTEDGTGIVHISKTFGADDYRVSVKNNIPGVLVKDDEGNDVPIVDREGKFVSEITDFAGMYVKNYTDEDESADDYMSTDLKIALKLKEEGRAFKIEKYVHSYPHCWRTDKPVLYYPLDSWFIRTTAFKDRLVELNNTINWKPASTGTGRFGNWLENLVDWNLSRSRFWGTPLPVWVSEDRKEMKCIGSVAELKSEVRAAIDAGIMNSDPFDGQDKPDLHKPFVDKVVLVSETGQKMFREPDLIDVWFDSGSMPYAQNHYPFASDSLEGCFPADFIAEGVDQTRGWFFTLHAIATMVFDQVAFKNVIANGLVLDKDGNKMSKRLGNAVDPFGAIADYGADANRWYMIANANPWDNLKFNMEGVQEVQRRFFGTLHNTYSFFALYANLDGFDFSRPLLEEALTESDRWVLSRLNSVCKEVDSSLNDYEPTKAARAIQEFVTDDLSNWYVRLNRKRFWKGELNDDKYAAYQTLYTCLVTVAKLMSPVAPFYSERLFQDLNKVTGQDQSESVHLSSFPEANEQLIDTDLELRMKLAQDISSVVHSIRKKHKIKVRQPLSKVLIPVLDEDFKKHIEEVEKLILSEVNTKLIEYIHDTSKVVVKTAKPNFRKLGQLYGPKIKQIAAKVSQFTNDEIGVLESGQEVSLDIDGEQVQLTLDDVEISSQDIPGWAVGNVGKITVALDLHIDEELRLEGIARDLVNRIQNIRKDQGLDVQDKIKITYNTKDELIKASFDTFRSYICEETQALSAEMDEHMVSGEQLEIDDLGVKISVTK